MKYILLLTGIILFAGCQSGKYEYQIHLEKGIHLISTDTKEEAKKFLSEQEKSHGKMLIRKHKVQ